MGFHNKYLLYYNEQFVKAEELMALVSEGSLSKTKLPKNIMWSIGETGLTSLTEL